VNSTTKIFLSLPLLLLGCQTYQPTAFAPLDARLEPTPFGGARYFVLVNTSCKDLHNVSRSVYVWNNQNVLLERRYTRRLYLNRELLSSGAVVRTHGFANPTEEPLVEPITGVEVVGHCDEGSFRESWINNGSEELRPAKGKAAP
jgi:hypothetical protein